jgi:hypothetical protein
MELCKLILLWNMHNRISETGYGDGKFFHFSLILSSFIHTGYQGKVFVHECSNGFSFPIQQYDHNTISFFQIANLFHLIRPEWSHTNNDGGCNTRTIWKLGIQLLFKN